MNEQVVTELTIDARGALQGSATYVEAMNAAQAAVDRVIDRQAAVDAAQDKQTAVMTKGAQSITRVAASWDRLRASIDPVTKAEVAAQAEMNRALVTVDNAVKRGLATQEQAAAVIAELQAKQIAGIEAVKVATEEETAIQKLSTEAIETTRDAAKSLLASLGGGVALVGLAELPGKIIDINHEAAGLVHTSEIIGTTTKALQELNYAASQIHVAPADFDKELETFSKNMGLAQEGTSQLAKILAANHVAITGNAMTDLKNYAELVKNAATEQQRNLLVTAAFGKGAQAAGLLFADGAAGIQKWADQADQLGILSDKDLKGAADLDTQWGKTSQTFTTAFQDFAITIAPAVVLAVENIAGSIRDVKKAFDELKSGNILDGLKQLLDVDTSSPGATLNSLVGLANRLNPAGAAGQAIGNWAGNLIHPAAPTIADDTTGFPGQGSAPAHAVVRGATVLPNLLDGAAAKKAADQYRALTAEAANATASLVEQQQALGQTSEQTAYLAEQQTLLNKANSDGLKLSPTQLSAIDAEARGYAKQKSILDALTDTYNTGKDAFKGFFSDIVADQRQGESVWQSLADAATNALDKIEDKMLDVVTSDAWDALWTGGQSGGSGGIGGIASTVLGWLGRGGGSSGVDANGFSTADSSPEGFAGGGWTGAGSAREPAGVVHRNEYVFDAATTARIGVPALDAMRAGVRGYLAGGLVTGGYAPMPAANANGPMAANTNAPQVNVSIVHQAGPGQDRVSVSKRNDGGLDIKALVRDTAAQAAVTPGNALNKSLRTGLGARQQLIRRG